MSYTMATTDNNNTTIHNKSQAMVNLNKNTEEILKKVERVYRLVLEP